MKGGREEEVRGVKERDGGEKGVTDEEEEEEVEEVKR